MRILAPLAIACVIPYAGFANPLTTALEAEQPCKELAPLDKTDHARIDTAGLQMNGELVTLSASGSIRCKTSDQAMFPASASADFDLSASGDFETCAFPQSSVALRNVGGPLDLFRSAIEDALSDALRDALVDACEDLK